MVQWIQRQAKHSEILEKHLSLGKLSSMSMKCWRADTFRRKRGKNCKSNALCFFLPGLWCYLQLSKFSCMYLPDSKWLFYFFLCSTDFTLFEGWLTQGCVWSCCLSHDKGFSIPKRPWYGQSPVVTAWMVLPWPGMDLDGLSWLSDQEPRCLITAWLRGRKGIEVPVCIKRTLVMEMWHL